MIAQEGSPSLAGWSPSFNHVLGDARLRDLKPELEQFAVDARRTPKQILRAHLPDQRTQFRLDRRSPSPSTRLPTPIAAKAGPMPTYQRFGSNDQRLANSISKTDWPGQKTRLSLPAELMLTATERAEMERRLVAIKTIITGSNLTPAECSKARLSLLTRMQLAFPAFGNSSDAAADARGDIYDDAVEDIPPWALSAAIKRWTKGDVPELRLGALNFNFAPGPAVLLAICKLELADFKAQALAIERLLACVTHERAMDPTPIPVDVRSDGGRVLSFSPRRM